jgi:hypothetical protein
MTKEEKKTAKSDVKATSVGKILAGALYILTFLFVLGFIWQSIASFVIP